jgi:NAD(P)-dependent dehydrogenase (short-subunit alcohol dehydrogenase family)
MDVSLNGALHTMHHELSTNGKTEKQVIVNIASILVKLVTSSFQYCAAKEKVIGLT